jgi:hypothetical protein
MEGLMGENWWKSQARRPDAWTMRRSDREEGWRSSIQADGKI